MRIFFRSSLFILLLLSLISCKKHLTAEVLPAHIAIGDVYYAQFNIRYEKNVHLTTNYRRGGSIAVNTAINLVEITNKNIDVEIANSGQKVQIRNVEKHTGDDTVKAFDKLFGKRKVNLSAFNRLERKHIKAGTVAKGMRKKAVTVAIGYPPTTETYNLDADKWVYWSHRFNKFEVNFNRGKVSSVVD